MWPFTTDQFWKVKFLYNYCTNHASSAAMAAAVAIGGLKPSRGLFGG